MASETVIRGARIIDGTGAPWYRGDVRLAGGRIAAVGPQLDSDGAPTVDAGERYLAPGFIDAHCHDDLIFLRDPERPEKAVQGVTTIVVGNCSFSLYPATDGSRDLLQGHFSSLLGRMQPDEVFDDFTLYRDRLYHQGIALNIVSLVGHAALRLAVMGYDRRPAGAAEQAAMQALLDRQLAAGAAGLSLGLVYPPSAYAEPEELVALARTVRAHGKVLTAHVRSYEAALIPAITEFIGVLRASGCAGLLSHLQAAGRPYWGGVPKALAVLEAARREGVDISFDMYPYPAGSSYALQLLPPAAQEGGLAALRARLRDPEARAALRHWVEDGHGAWPGPSKVSLIGWGNIRISGTSNPALKGLEGLSMADAAAREGCSGFDLLARLVEEDEGQTGVVMFQLSEDDVQAACCHHLYMAGSDSLPRPGTRPHPRGYGTFPRILGEFSRERGWFPIEDAVRRMTATAAQRFNLADRGLIRPGLAADLVLFDPAVADRATFDAPTELAQGVTHVWVAGEAVVAEGRPTGARPGRVL